MSTDLTMMPEEKAYSEDSEFLPPDDEPVGVLLERIHAERATRETTKKARGRRAKEMA